VESYRPTSDPDIWTVVRKLDLNAVRKHLLDAHSTSVTTRRRTA
jgi:hypothetical protein